MTNSALKNLGILIIGAFMVCIPAIAQQTNAIDESIISNSDVEKIKQTLNKEVIYISIETKNRERLGISKDEILELDKQWRAEVKSSDAQPLISASLGSPVSTFLLRVQGASAGLYNEIFVMDVNGLNVGQSTITTDYWQGDEAKVQKTLDVGLEEVFIDSAEYNAEKGIWLSQVNLTLSKNGKAIGAATVEVNLTELKRRKELGLS